MAREPHVAAAAADPSLGRSAPQHRAAPPHIGPPPRAQHTGPAHVTAPLATAVSEVDGPARIAPPPRLPRQLSPTPQASSFPHGARRATPLIVSTAAAAAARRPHPAAAGTAGASTSGAPEERAAVGRPSFPDGRAESRDPARWPLLRIVCWELVVVLGFLAIGRSVPALIGLTGGSLALLALSTMRVRGHWMSTVLARRIGLALRPKRAASRHAEDAPGALLELLVPGARTYEAQVAGGTAGVLSRPDELVSVLRPAQGAPGDVVRRALLDAVLREPAGEGPQVALQVVLHRGPQQLGQQLVSSHGWLAVRVLRSPDSAQDDVLQVALSNAVRRVRRGLRKAGLDTHPLSGAELRTTLSALTHTAVDHGTVREEWGRWRTGHVIQVGILLTGTAARTAERTAMFERLLAAAPGAACTLTTDGRAGEPMVLRLAATTEAALISSADQLIRLAAALGLRAERLDGRHARSVAATLPIGGTFK